MERQLKTLSLRANNVEKYWQTQSRSFAEIFKMIEDNEFWTVDDGDVLEALDRLAHILYEPVVTEDDILRNQADLFVVLAYIKISKALRIVDFLAEKYQPTSAKDEVLVHKLLKIAIDKRGDQEVGNIYRLFLERLVFVRNSCEVVTIFDEKKIKEIEKMLEEGGLNV